MIIEKILLLQIFKFKSSRANKNQKLEKKEVGIKLKHANFLICHNKGSIDEVCIC